MYIRPKTVGETIKDAVADKIRSLNPVQSDWTYSGFNNGGLSVGTPGVDISFGLSGGRLDVKKNGSANSFYCGSVDGGVGLTPTPFNVSFPIPDMPGTGIIFKLPNSGGSITANSFRGGYIMVNGAIQCGLTANLNFMFCGSKILPVKGIDYNYLIGMILNSPVLIVSVGVAGALIPDIGITCSVGVSL